MSSDPGRRQAGFTLIEILVVVVVLAIVFAIALVSLLGALDRAKQRATMSDMRTISKAIEVYQVDHGFYPDTSGDMEALRDLCIPDQTSAFPVDDHWGHRYVYSSNGQDAYTLVSTGKDGVDGDDITFPTRFEYTRDIVMVDGLFAATPE